MVLSRPYVRYYIALWLPCGCKTRLLPSQFVIVNIICMYTYIYIYIYILYTHAILHCCVSRSLSRYINIYTYIYIFTYTYYMCVYLCIYVTCMRLYTQRKTKNMYCMSLFSICTLGIDTHMLIIIKYIVHRM